MSKQETKRLRPVVKIHGGKHYLNKWILDNFPNNYEEYVYCEPFGGAGSVLLNKQSNPQEFYNDLDLGLVQIFRSLRDDPTSFISRLKKVKYQESSFDRYLNKQKKENYSDYVDHAICEFVVRRMSRGGLGKTFAWSDRQRGGKPGDVNAWDTIISSLPDISERISNIIITNKNTIDIIQSFNDPKCLIYLDPPYLPEVRVTKKVYNYEMTSEQHLKLVKTINSFKSKVLISGYPSRLYDKILKNWTRIEKPVVNHSSQTKTKPVKTEALWMNF